MAAPHHRWPPGLRRRILQRDGECKVRFDEHCTGKPEHVDHIVSPLDGGPRFDESNLRASCASCNVRRENARRRADRTARARAGEIGSPSRQW